MYGVFFILFGFLRRVRRGAEGAEKCLVWFFSCGVRREMYGEFFMSVLFLRRVWRGAEGAEKCMVCFFCFFICVFVFR